MNVVPRFKEQRVRDRRYLDSYEGQECIACGSTYGVVGAHIRTGHEGGTSLKPDDSLTLPLCAYCHADQEKHPGPWWWLESVVKAIARRRYAAWKARRA